MTLSDLEWLSKVFNDMKSHGLSATAELLVDLLKTMTSPNRKPKVVLGRRSNCHEFKNDKNNHITVIGMLFCISLPNCTVAD